MSCTAHAVAACDSMVLAAPVGEKSRADVSPTFVSSNRRQAGTAGQTRCRAGVRWRPIPISDRQRRRRRNRHCFLALVVGWSSAPYQDTKCELDFQIGCQKFGLTAFSLSGDDLDRDGQGVAFGNLDNGFGSNRLLRVRPANQHIQLFKSVWILLRTAW